MNVTVQKSTISNHNLQSIFHAFFVAEDATESYLKEVKNGLLLGSKLPWTSSIMNELVRSFCLSMSM